MDRTHRVVAARAEQRDGDTIFVAEVRLDNHLGQLRPGMSGRADRGARPFDWLDPVPQTCRSDLPAGGMVAVDHSPDYRVHDLLRLRPALRGDLVFTPCGGGIPYYRVEDPLRGKFYRVGLAEYALISLLDGRRTLEEVLRRPLPC